MHSQSGQMIIDRERERVGGPVSLCLGRSAWTEGSRGQETRGLTHRHAHTGTLTLLCMLFLSHSGFVMCENLVLGKRSVSNLSLLL